MSGKELVLPLCLESAVAIGILAVGIGECHEFASGHLHGFHCLYQVFHLCSVCTYVLHG